MVSFPRGFDRFGERASDHHRVRTASQGFTNIASFTHATVGNDGHVPASPLQVIVSGGCAIHGRGDLRYAKAQDASRSASCARPYTDQNSCHPAFHNFKGDLKRLCPRGADVVLDMVGGDYTEAALRATGFGGRFVVVGFAAGQVPRVPLNLVLLKGSSIHGYEIVDFERHRPQEAEANRAALERMLSDGQVKPAITATYPLDRAPEAVRNVSGRDKQGVSILTFS